MNIILKWEAKPDKEWNRKRKRKNDPNGTVVCPSKLLFLLSLKLEVSHVTRERFAKVFFFFVFFCKKLHSMQPAMCAIWREWFSLITMIWHFFVLILSFCWFIWNFCVIYFHVLWIPIYFFFSFMFLFIHYMIADWRCKCCGIFLLGCLCAHALSATAKQLHFHCWCRVQADYQPTDSIPFPRIPYLQVSNCKSFIVIAHLR